MCLCLLFVVVSMTTYTYIRICIPTFVLDVYVCMCVDGRLGCRVGAGTSFFFFFFVSPSSFSVINAATETKIGKHM